MSMKAELIVCIRIDHYGPTFENRVTIDGPYEIGFEPIDRVDDPRLAMMGGKMPGQVRVIAKMRKDSAKRLASQIADEIYKLMESRDTINGYPIERTPPNPPTGGGG